MRERLDKQSDLLKQLVSNKAKKYVNSNYVRVCYEIAEMGSFLQQENITFAYAVSFADEKAYIERVIQEKVDYICILTRYFTDIQQYREIISFVRARDPSVAIVVGSGFLVNAINKLKKTKEYQYFLQGIGADYYINKFEFSHEFSRVIQAKHEEISLQKIHNLFYKTDGRYQATHQDRNPVGNPAEVVDWSRFKNLIRPVTAMKTTISCPLHCSFCAVKGRTEKFQLLDLELIRREILSIQRKGITRLIHFVDETINLPRQRFKLLLEMLIGLAQPIHWCSFVNVSYLDEEIIMLMKKSGCVAVMIGFESGCNELLTYMNKQTTVKVMHTNHALLKKHGILTYGFFIVGFPGETEATVRQTVDFIDTAQPTFYKIHKWSCEPGTDIWNERERWNLAYKNGDFFHATMDSHQAGRLIRQAYSRITNSISIEHVDFLLTLQLYLDGVPLQSIRQFIEKERG